MQTVNPSRRIAVAIVLCAVAALAPELVHTPSTASAGGIAPTVQPIGPAPDGRGCGFCWEQPVG